MECVFKICRLLTIWSIWQQDPESVEALLATAMQLQGERGDPTARGGVFLRLAIRRLGVASAQIHAAAPGASLLS